MSILHEWRRLHTIYISGLTISSIEKNSFWTAAGLRHTQAASWAIVWTVHSKRKKLAGSLSHIVCRVRRSWQQSRESWDSSREACSRWMADRFFTAAPVDDEKVLVPLTFQKRSNVLLNWIEHGLLILTFQIWRKFIFLTLTQSCFEFKDQFIRFSTDKVR